MVKHFLAIPLALLLLFSSCATVNVYHSNPASRTVKNEYFDLLIEPQPADGHYYFNAFRFVLTNKSNQPLNILWEQSYYLLNGRKNGQFGWEGMTFESLKEIRKNPYVKIDVGATSTGIVFPLKMMARISLKDRAKLGESKTEDQFEMGPLPKGENGMLLAVQIDGKVVQEKVVFVIDMTPMSTPPK